VAGDCSGAGVVGDAEIANTANTTTAKNGFDGGFEGAMCRIGGKCCKCGKFGSAFCVGNVVIVVSVSPTFSKFGSNFGNGKGEFCAKIASG
jgi:hypothetical protein